MSKPTVHVVFPSQFLNEVTKGIEGLGYTVVQQDATLDDFTTWATSIDDEAQADIAFIHTSAISSIYNQFDRFNYSEALYTYIRDSKIHRETMRMVLIFTDQEMVDHTLLTKIAALGITDIHFSQNISLPLMDDWLSRKRTLKEAQRLFGDYKVKGNQPIPDNEVDLDIDEKDYPKPTKRSRLFKKKEALSDQELLNLEPSPTSKWWKPDPKAAEEKASVKEQKRLEAEQQKQEKAQAKQMALEEKRALKEQKRQEKEQQKLAVLEEKEKEKQLLEQEKKVKEEAKARAEEQKRLEEQQRLEREAKEREEAQAQVKEQERLEKQRRIEQEKKEREEADARAKEQKRLKEQQQLEQEAKEREEAKAQAEEQKRIAEKQRLEQEAKERKKAEAQAKEQERLEEQQLLEREAKEREEAEAEEQKRLEKQQRLEQEKKEQEEAKARADEQKRLEEQQRLEQEAKEREEAEAQAKEQKRLEKKQRLEQEAKEREETKDQGKEQRKSIIEDVASGEETHTSDDSKGFRRRLLPILSFGDKKQTAPVKNQVIAVIGVTPQSGSSLISYAAARMFADQGSTVKLIESPYAHPYLAHAFGLYHHLTDGHEPFHSTFNQLLNDYGIAGKLPIYQNIHWNVKHPVLHQTSLADKWTAELNHDLILHGTRDVTIIDLGSTYTQPEMKKLLEYVDRVIVLVDPNPTQVYRSEDAYKDLLLLQKQFQHISFIGNRWSKSIDREQFEEMLPFTLTNTIDDLPGDLLYPMYYQRQDLLSGILGRHIRKELQFLNEPHQVLSSIGS
ncbi:hypothetical protein DH09_00500 (plasmid) [Bacillaceae bacterium JMAK1]|nr:hypothetical protein DH09_00500 [Bacillaceae bacterium JMAK1]